ncbi:MAG: Rieske 2Fe-2S domain-containing protein [Burkholderiales bacterium]|nr:Rieske 2Fe-2S domain-containing protein [Burkholderiales bacterium]MDE2078570.1 Rieske 2Fe-2S domain-containing protein [Burkholderiales bacterium]MDE2431891.1 Rieske 2Fe-2S domain-containing protein [Burkholderiales bacterium]HET8694104.1 Rieske 2Fe-2S domain-containing protein [Aquabacterium sp.]
MPDSIREWQPLCSSSDLEEAGKAVLFDVMEFGQSVQAFAIRYDNVPVAYVNRCAHVPTAMDWQEGQFFDQDRRFIICSIHGALYHPPSGECVAGPCAGARLLAIELKEQGGQVFWRPTQRLQPLF